MSLSSPSILAFSYYISFILPMNLVHSHFFFFETFNNIINGYTSRFAIRDRELRDLTKLISGHNFALNGLLITPYHHARTRENKAQNFFNGEVEYFFPYRESISDILPSKSNAFFTKLY